MIVYLLIVLGIALVAYYRWNFSYWKRKGFPYVEAQTPFGVLEAVRRRQRSVGMAIYDVYKNSEERVLGIYLVTRPALLVRDAQLAHDMLTKDFASFHDRGIYVDEQRHPLSSNLLALKGKSWRTLRTRLTPSFSSGKLKGMFGTIQDSTLKMVQHLNKQLPMEGSLQVEMKQVLVTYAVDIIASVIFGLDIDSFEQPNNEFYTISKRINENKFSSVLRSACQFLYPNLEKLFQCVGWVETAPKRMREIVRRTVEYRERNNVERKDMLQLLLQLRNTGKIDEDDNVWSAIKTADELKEMSIEAITAHLLLFYVAGFETTASSAAFTLYELAQYPELLAKARADVQQALQRHGALTYEALQDMRFLDLCLMETIRKYPGLPILNRECTQDFHIPNSDKVIEKGTPIIISLFGIHRDAEYFPEPLRYDPERFRDDNTTYNPIAYMPFGAGPRHCIAQRMGKLNAKAALAQIFANFHVELNSSPYEIEMDNFGIPIMPKGGIPVTLSKKPQQTEGR